jgi:hypothetical protein
LGKLEGWLVEELSTLCFAKYFKSLIPLKSMPRMKSTDSWIDVVILGLGLRCVRCSSFPSHEAIGLGTLQSAIPVEVRKGLKVNIEI